MEDLTIGTLVGLLSAAQEIREQIKWDETDRTVSVIKEIMEDCGDKRESFVASLKKLCSHLRVVELCRAKLT